MNYLQRRKIALVLIKILRVIVYAVLLTVTCFGTALWFVSPFVLGGIIIADHLDKTIPLFNGSMFYLWLVSIIIVFVPLLIYSIVYRIKQDRKNKKALKEALEKAKVKGEKDKG